jgi:hypothetical protein
MPAQHRGLGGADRPEQRDGADGPEHSQHADREPRERAVERARHQAHGPAQRAGRGGDAHPGTGIERRQHLAQHVRLRVAEHRALAGSGEHDGKKRGAVAEPGDRGQAPHGGRDREGDELAQRRRDHPPPVGGRRWRDRSEGGGGHAATVDLARLLGISGNPILGCGSPRCRGDCRVRWNTASEGERRDEFGSTARRRRTQPQTAETIGERGGRSPALAGDPSRRSRRAAG